jgi:hypothetical protein
MLHVSLLPELPTIAVSCASDERIAHLAVLCCLRDFDLAYVGFGSMLLKKSVMISASPSI